MSGYRNLLPPAEELIRLKDQPGATYESIGKRYGTSRQAVHKSIRKHKQKQADEQSAG